MASTRNKKANDNQINHYVLDELLVEQAASAIYMAKDTKTDESVFLVTLQPEAAKSTDLSERFQRRAETLSQLEDATLLPLQDFGVDGKRPYAAMPYRSGQFLSEKLENTPPLPQESPDKTEIIAALELVKKVATGLSIAHPTGLIHHDLRPENIYLDDSGNPYLLDLAVPPVPPIVSQLDEAQPTELDYQSPEQKAGKALSGRSNVFSLGILVYRLLAGHQPALPLSEWDIFEQKGTPREVPLNQVRTDLATATYVLVQNSIWQREWSRYETVNAQLEAFDEAIAAESAPPPPPPPIWLRLFNRLRQTRLRKFIIPAIVLLFLLLLVVMLMRGRGNRQQNVTPSPEAVILPAVVATTAVPQTDEALTNSPTNTAPAMQEPGDTAATSEDEVLPPTEEVETPTNEPSPTAVQAAPTPTELAPTATATTTSTPTETPTLEPTETSCVPSPPFGWVRYTIQANDSLSSLSQATGTTVARLQEVNCLETNLLNVGQQIWLPASPNPTDTPAAPEPTDPAATAVPPAIRHNRHHQLQGRQRPPFHQPPRHNFFALS
ncbi:protein kinase domain-containing protein [Candidatus Leptofilum sp.]|uniref:protein kinase domain-containing protein n=1 Tax=Candidatus Leptofilum sp. TaxID=3241576 RepID=UPI003B5A30E4